MTKSKGVGRALPGNKNATKLKDPDVRQEAFRQYCAHLAAGYPKEAFHFDHPVHSVTWATMEKYIEENPAEFSPILTQRAKALRFKYWFDEGRKLMQGCYKGGSPVVWQTIMRNIFKDVGWDVEQKSGDTLDLNKLNALKEFFSAIPKIQQSPLNHLPQSTIPSNSQPLPVSDSAPSSSHATTSDEPAGPDSCKAKIVRLGTNFP